MADKPYVIVVDGNGAVSERKIGDHVPGTLLSPTQVTVVSSTVSNGMRSVVLSRAFEGITQDHFTFGPTKTSIPFINAIGRTPNFAHHQSKGSGTLTFIALNEASCVCDDGIFGTINGIAFHRLCAPEPTSDLVTQKNPTCWIQTYVGGLHCCHHEYILLDADQMVDTRVDEVYLKFRVWFQEYQPPKPTNPTPSHLNLYRFYFQTEAFAGEYDVPQCPAGTPPQECVHQITSRIQAKDMFFDCMHGKSNCTGVIGMKLIYAGAHCHAPSCISMELYNLDTGTLICRQIPQIGTGRDTFDELDYLNVPPCLWGSPDEGLIPPPFLSLDTKLMAIKRNNNTYGHFGEMASWQMRGIYVYNTDHE